MIMEEIEDLDFALTVRNKQWLKQRENTFATLAQEGIIYDQLLGEGSYAKVISAYYGRIDRKVAVKITDKRKAPIEYVERFLQREVDLLCELDHPNIVKILALFESNAKIFMIVELCSGGDLLEFVNEKRYKDQEETRKHFKQLSSAICYSHDQGIIHRDLKLENLVLDSEGNIKVTDFGFARRTLQHDNVDTFCGSFAYACPAVLRGEPYNGYAADIWSMGIILYAMLTYRLPYNESDLVTMSNCSSIKKLKFTKDTPVGARDLIRRMLEVDPDKRITAREILNHEWICNVEVPQSIEETLLKLDKNSSMSNEKQFQTVAIRRSTITSMDVAKSIKTVVRSGNNIREASTLQKKEMAERCGDRLGKKKAENNSNRLDKMKPENGKDVELSSLVTQVMHAKRMNENIDAGKCDDKRDYSKQMIGDLATSTDSSKKMNERSKLHNWKKVCSTLTGKAG